MIRVPSFLTKVNKEEKNELMREYVLWKKQHCTEHLAAYIQGELDKLISEDEKVSFSTWFQTKWEKATRLGKRKALRQILKDLT